MFVSTLVLIHMCVYDLITPQSRLLTFLAIVADVDKLKKKCLIKSAVEIYFELDLKIRFFI